jgi:predicted PurR-regulated permease PerM
MSENTNSPYSKELSQTLLALVLIIALLYTLQSVLVPLMFSILIAISLFPVTRFLEKVKLNRVTASLLSVLLAVILVGTLIWFIVHQVIVIGSDGAELQSKLMGIVNTIQKWVSDRFGIEESKITEKFREAVNQGFSNAGTYLTAAFGSVGGILAGTVIVPLFTFFLLYYRDFFREFFFHAFASTPKEKVQEVLNKIYDVVQSYLLGLVTVMGIVAVLNTGGLLLLGIEYAWFFGTLASLLMLLPYIGIAIGSILPAIFALATKDNSWYAVGVVGWFQVVQFLEGNLITPNIVGGKVSINPLMALISLLLGGMLFGLAGLILALPAAAVLKVFFDAVPSMKPWGFLIGEPENYHLRKYSGMIILKKWRLKDKFETEKVNESPDNHPTKNGGLTDKS